MQVAYSRLCRARCAAESQLGFGRKYISLRRKLITGIVLAIAFVSVGLTVIEISVQTMRVSKELAVKGSVLANTAANLAGSPLALNIDTSIDEAMQQLMSDDDIAYIRVEDTTGKTRSLMGSTNNMRWMYQAPVVYRNSHIGTLYLGISFASVDQVRNQVLLDSLLSLSVTLLILIILVNVITQFFIAPIEALKETVANASRGEYVSKVQTYTNDEIGVLAHYINSSIELIAQREDRLRDSESRFRLIADNATDIISICALDSTLLYLSPSVQRVLGYMPEELVGRKIVDLIDEDDMPLFHQMLALPPQLGEHFTITYRMTHRDGHLLWLETANHTVANRSGGFELQSSTREITEKMAAAAQLQESLEKYRVLFETLPVGVAFVNRNGNIEEMNRTFAEATGGHTLQDRSNMPWTTIYPDGTPIPQNELPAAVAMREDRVVNDVVGLTGDGDMHWVNVTAAPFRQQNFGAVMACVDITDRMVADQLLLSEKERLRITLESIGDAVIATNGQGIITLMNEVAAQFTGWPVSEAVGMPLYRVFNVFNEATGEAVLNPVDKVLSSGSVVEMANHTMVRSRDGTTRFIANSAAPIMDSARNILGVIMVVRDVSEQKEKEKAQIFQNYHDLVTGLYNRAYFEEELSRLDQGRQLPISILMGDVNGLKLTNDVFGHDEGDNLLKRIARVLSGSCRGDDIVARTGGDEFCILLPRTTAEEAEMICQRIYAACAAQQEDGANAGLRLSISLGYATKDTADRRLLSVLKAAEDSMYKRKLLESRGQHSSIVTTIRSTLNEKSHETEDHSFRLMFYARMVGMKAMLSSDQMSDLELLAVMHDIGKITVDDAVLNKAGPLTDAEWEQIKKHPEMGYRIASGSPELMTIANCILAHHERWDGQGYPQGLSGADIPLLSRILTIVDSYDAMTQDRVYRKALGRDMALAELRRNAGTQFDPELVEIFIQCVVEAA